MNNTELTLDQLAEVSGSVRLTGDKRDVQFLFEVQLLLNSHKKNPSSNNTNHYGRAKNSHGYDFEMINDIEPLNISGIELGAPFPYDE